MQALRAEPRQGLTDASVQEALSLKRGARTREGVDVLDSSDRLTNTLLVVKAQAGSVTWSYRAPDRVVGQSGGVAAVRRRATLNIPLAQSSELNLNNSRLRLWTEWQLADGSWARFWLGVFVVVNPGAVVDDGVQLSRSLELADKSYLWANKFLAEPVTVPAGTVAVDWVKSDLTSRFGETVFALPASTATLPLARVFETGTSMLEVYSRVLEGAGFDQLTATESGRPTTQPLADLASRGVEHTYGAGKGKVVVAGQVEPLLPTLPNVVRFSARQGPSLGNIEGNGLRTVKNQSTGPASIDARGGVEIELRVDVDAANQAALDAIAYADSQRYFAGGGERWSGRVALNPLHSDRDVVALGLPRLGIVDTSPWLVTEWTYPLAPRDSPGAVLMDITCERRVATS